MTPEQFTDRYHFFLQRVYEVIGRLPDPEDFDKANPASATQLRKIQEEVRVVQRDITKLDEELDDELGSTKPCH
jgi:hypothetical protein